MENFINNMLNQELPKSIQHNVSLPRRKNYYSSPVDWRNEVLYFLLVDRFSDNKEGQRQLLNRQQLNMARPQVNGEPWRWDSWAESGASRWQGGTINGVKSKLGYLKNLGVTSLWLSPVFKQRKHLDTYHGYGIQDFLDVDPHFGSRADLVNLIAEAHKKGLRVILDIIFNHSGANWVYPDGKWKPPYKPYPDQYQFGSWLGEQGQEISEVKLRGDGVWPTELQDKDCYTRAGKGGFDHDEQNINDEHAEHKRTDFEILRDFQLSSPGTLNNLALCYKYWIALSDCDGFRIDTLKHVSLEAARNFCGTVKEFAANLGKNNFFLIGEIAGGDMAQDRYLDVLDRNLDSALDIGEMRLALNAVAKGLAAPKQYFEGFDPWKQNMGSHRNLGERHVSVLDDHDHVMGGKIRFSSLASSDHQVAAGVALQLFTLGIPCIYYGTEQAFAGPEPDERVWVPYWNDSDRYLREAMFGPEHPKKSGGQGLAAHSAGIDTSLPGFGPFGTAGQHCFDEKNPVYLRITALTALRNKFPVLRFGRQYLRPISLFGLPFHESPSGEIIAWSRILDDEEALCLINSHGVEERGADVLVDAALNSPTNSMKVILNTAQAANPSGYKGSHPVGSKVSVSKTADGTAHVKIRNVSPSEVLVLINQP